MDFLLLGPLEARYRGSLFDLGPRRTERCLLGLLLLEAGRVVPSDRLQDLLWDDRPPENARASIQIHVSRLRARLDPGRDGRYGVRLPARQAGYLIEVEPQKVDVHRFRTLVAQAVGLPHATDRAAGLRTALALWRGPLLDQVATDRLRERIGSVFDEQQLQAWEACMEAELAAGRHREIITELIALVEANPLRERLVGALMLALYRDGRQADALLAYRQVSRRVADEYGLDVGTELSQLHDAILRTDGSLDLLPQGTVVVRDPGSDGPGANFLPRDMPDFVGREADLRTLDAFTAHTAPIAIINTVVGVAGVGKTALAVRWAHQIGGSYPDGQLFVNLRGYDHGQPLRPLEALGHLLRCLGVPPDQLPSGLDDAAARYRAMLAGKRMLILLDNARTADQVRPLLPGSTGCLVVVTSRDRLSGLLAKDGAYRLTLGVLARDEATTLLRRLVGADRVDAEPAAAERLIEICGGLPLALRIASANLADHPDRPICDYVDILTSGSALTGLTVEGDEHNAVQSVLEQSYRALDPAVRHVFRALGAIAGPDFDIEAVAAAADRTASEARAAVAILTDSHLVDEYRPGRFACHDLVGEFAHAKLAASGQAQAAFRSLLGYLRYAVALANSIIASKEFDHADPQRCVPELSSVSEAMTWLEVQRPGLVAAVSAAAAGGEAELACAIAQELWQFFHFAGHTSDWITTFECAVAALDGTDDDATLSYLLNGLGGAYIKAGRYQEAITIHRHCASVRQTLGDRSGLARSRLNLALSLERLGRYDEALREVLAGLELLRALDERLFEVSVISGSLVGIYLHAGRYAEARDQLREILPIVREIGTPVDVGRVLTNLGESHRFLGEPDVALPHLEEALELQRRDGNRHGESVTLGAIADTLRDLGDYERAIAMRTTAIEMISQWGMRGEECEGWIELAHTYVAAGQDQDARHAYARALELARELGEKHQEARALAGWGCLLAAEDRTAAQLHLNEAVTILDVISPAEATDVRRVLADLTSADVAAEFTSKG